MGSEGMGVWELPKGWEMLPLGEVCEINPRRPRLSRNDDTPTSFVPMAAVDEVQGVIADLQTRPYCKVKRGYTYFEEGDVLFAKITPSMQNGKSVITRGLIDSFGFGSTEFHVLRPFSRVIPEWVHLFVRQKSFRDEAMQHFRGAVGQQRVPAEFLESYSFPLPPLDEQRRIVARIEELFARIEKARRLRAAADQDAERLMDAVRVETFEQDVDELPKKWRIFAIGEVCLVNPRRPRLKRKGDISTSFVPMSAVDEATGTIAVMETRPYERVRSGYTYFEEHDVLFAKITPCMQNGKSAIARSLRDGIGFGSTEFHVLRCSELVLPEWVHQFIRQQTFREEATYHFRGAVGQQRVPKEFLEQHSIPVPPLSEQRRIVEYLDDVQAHVTELKRFQTESVAELERLSGAVLARAFRGEL